MTEKEAIKILDNIFTDILIKKKCGEKYSIAIKVILVYYKYYKDSFERELENNRENILELIEKSEELNLYNETEIALNNRIIDLELELKKKDKIIDEMCDYFSKNRMYGSKEQIKEYFEKRIQEEN